MGKASAFLILSLILSTVVEAQELASLEQQRKAAEQGSSDDQVDMGILYEFGFNMPKNHVNALAWYMRAADQGNAVAGKRRDLLKAQMKPEEIEAAQQLSMELGAKKPEALEAPVQPPMTEQVPATAQPAGNQAPAEKPPAAP